MKKLPIVLATCLLPLLSACEALELVNSVGSILDKGPSSASANPSPAPNTTGAAATPVVLQPGTAAPAQAAPASPTPVATPPLAALEIVRSTDPTPVSTDWNLARHPDVELNVSSVLNDTFDKQRLLDGKLTTSWFTVDRDAPKFGRLPTIEVTFPKPVGIFSVNLRGDRERQQGMMIEEISLLITSPQGILLNETVAIPPNTEDLNLVLRKPLDQASAIRLTITKSRSTPGLAELEILGRP